MRLEKLSAITELVSSVAILATLVYLAIQTQQNTQAIQASVRQSMLAEDRELLYKQIDYPFIDWTTIDGRQLSPDQLFQVRQWLTAFLRNREGLWLQYQAGGIDGVTWSTYRSVIGQVLASRLAREIWEYRVARGEFTQGFVDDVDSIDEEP